MASPGVIGFLDLAYLIEISVVMNLAYRELKFRDLYETKLKDSIQYLRNLARQEKINTEYINTDLDIFISLEKHEKGESKTPLSLDIWNGEKNLQKFYTKYILHRLALNSVNVIILFNVLLLVVFTALSGIEVNSVWSSDRALIGLLIMTAGFMLPISVLLFYDSISLVNIKIFVGSVSLAVILGIVFLIASHAWGFGVVYEGSPVNINNVVNSDSFWAFSFGLMVAFVLIPIYFIRMSTKCEEFFYGKKGQPGMMAEIEKDLRSKRSDTNDSSVKDARNLTV